MVSELPSEINQRHLAFVSFNSIFFFNSQQLREPRRKKCKLLNKNEISNSRPIAKGNMRLTEDVMMTDESPIPVYILSTKWIHNILNITSHAALTFVLLSGRGLLAEVNRV